MRNVVQGLGMLAIGLVLGAGEAAAAPQYVLEVTKPTGGFFGRDAYTCAACSLDDFASLAVPGGFQKSLAKRFMPGDGTSNATPQPGTPASLDLILDLPGNEFEYGARVLSGVVHALSSPIGPLAVAQVERTSEFIYYAGDVIHEVIDTEGNHYILFLFAVALEPTIDEDAVGSLAGLPLPSGWTYASRTLASDLSVVSTGVASVFSQGGANNWQLYAPVPEPGSLVLVGGGAALLAIRARRSARD
jgi:hypothetical protein